MDLKPVSEYVNHAQQPSPAQTHDLVIRRFPLCKKLLQSLDILHSSTCDKIREGRSIDNNLSFQLIVLVVCIPKIFFNILLGKLIKWRIGFDLAIGDSIREGMVS